MILWTAGFSEWTVDLFDAFSLQQLDLFAWCVRLNWLLVGFWMHLISMHLHSFHSFKVMTDESIIKHDTRRWCSNYHQWVTPSTHSAQHATFPDTELFLQKNIWHIIRKNAKKVQAKISAKALLLVCCKQTECGHWF